MRQMGSVVVELDPTNHAVILQILRNFRFADSQMLGELRLESAIRHGTALPRSLRGAAAGPPRQIPKPYAQSLASFYVIRRNLIRIRKQKHAGSCRCGVSIVQSMERARY